MFEIEEEEEEEEEEAAPPLLHLVRAGLGQDLLQNPLPVLHKLNPQAQCGSRQNSSGKVSKGDTKSILRLWYWCTTELQLSKGSSSL